MGLKGAMGLILLETDQGGQCWLCWREGSYMTELPGGGHWILHKSLKAVAVLQLHLLRPIREGSHGCEVVQGG